MPDKPKKCWGKKVIFTPTNKIKNWTNKYLEFIATPVNKGNQ